MDHYTKKLYIESNDEVGELARYFNNFIANVHKIVKRVVSESEKLDSIFVKMSSEITELNNNIKDISIITDDISAGMQETAASTEEIYSVTSEIGNDLDNFSNKANKGTDCANEISERAIGVNNSAIISKESVETIYSNANKKLLDAIEQSKSIEKITETLDTIFEISAKTNILALNAANEGAVGTTNIAEKTSFVEKKSNDVVEDVLSAKDTVNKLNDMVAKFTV